MSSKAGTALESGVAISLSSVDLSFDEHGSGDGVLLLVHGHPFDRTMWNGQARFAAGLGWRVIVPDLRGYGRSPVVGAETTLDLFAADLAALLDRLNIGSVVIGGLSMGGQIAMAFAADYPERVRGLFLAATFETPDTEEGREVRERTAVRLLRPGGMRAYVSELLPRMLAPATIEHDPTVTAHVRTMMAGSSAAGAAAALRGRAIRPDYSSTLRAFTKPSLIIAGDQDEFTSKADAERMHGMMENSELLIVRGVGHMPNLESPAVTNDALATLLRRVASTEVGATHVQKVSPLSRASPL